MKSSHVFSLRRHVLQSDPFFSSASYLTRRHQSSLSVLQKSLYEKITSRGSFIRWERLHPIQSNHLTGLLSDYLPDSCHSPKGTQQWRRKSGTRDKTILPQGHHQVYFFPMYPEHRLLPDGTDDAHFPGNPYTRRLWAGGSLIFNPNLQWALTGDEVGIVQEDVEDVKVTGSEGEKKVFVTVSRKLAMYRGIESPANFRPAKFQTDLRTWEGTNLKEGKLGKLAMEEKKTLVFMRARTAEEKKQSLESVPKVIKPTHTPDFSVTLTPSAHLLSRFSALTLNAHRIHLDRQYCREVEGYPNLLVHGPLSQVLMLSVLRSQIDTDRGKMILTFDYKNLAPLYVDEPMRVCTRRNPKNPRKYDVWIEGKEGGYAVKATAEVGKRMVHELARYEYRNQDQDENEGQDQNQDRDTELEPAPSTTATN